MSERNLVAALACRNLGTRLYGKPMQNLDVENGVTILGHMIDLCNAVSSIDDIVLGISEGVANEVFFDVAREKSVKAIRGGEKDVLWRLIQCADEVNATDVFRVTTESPYFYYQKVNEVWERHIANGNDVTVIDGLPEGCHFEIYTRESLERSHREGDESHRSEFCSLYIRENLDQFKWEVVDVPDDVKRMDHRLTVDYPEDLVVCRKVYEKFADQTPLISVHDIIKFLDEHPELTQLLEPYVYPHPLWPVE